MRLLIDRLETSFLTFDVACGTLISAQPAAAHDEHDVPASPLGLDLLVGLAMHRIAFSQSARVALGTILTALAHPSTVRAMLAAQRDAAAQAPRRLVQLQRLGTPGAKALAASTAIPIRGAFLSNAVLTSCVSVEETAGRHRGWPVPVRQMHGATLAAPGGAGPGFRRVPEELAVP